jgi:hypothetical protein
MNKVIRRDMLARDLPEALASAFDPAETVAVEVTSRAGSPSADDREQFSRHRHLRRTTFRNVDEIVAHVRALRDEWD